DLLDVGALLPAPRPESTAATDGTQVTAAVPFR
ncbi:MAG: hypothetical protein JWO12_240, partial [Frankiales bacterium]|nr:hypothetical protein [Frankiales bacterium]